MRQFDRKSKKPLVSAGFNESYLVDLLVYNNRRDYRNRRFENWFDDKERLVKDLICDCSSGEVRINWEFFGNNSKGKGYRSFLNGEILVEPNWHHGTSDGPTYLGSYTRMRSPGVIRFYGDNLQVFFWSIICELACRHQYVFTREKVLELANLCIHKILYHELFHHFIDAQSYLVNGFTYDYYLDEALAVACSRLLVGYESKNNHKYVSDFLDLSYSYTLPGYRDWEEYKSEDQFIKRLISYMPLSPALAALGQEQSPICEGLLYSIIENPNVEFVVV